MPVIDGKVQGFHSCSPLAVWSLDSARGAGRFIRRERTRTAWPSDGSDATGAEGKRHLLKTLSTTYLNLA